MGSERGVQQKGSDDVEAVQATLEEWRGRRLRLDDEFHRYEEKTLRIVRTNIVVISLLLSLAGISRDGAFDFMLPTYWLGGIGVLLLAGAIYAGLSTDFDQPTVQTISKEDTRYLKSRTYDERTWKLYLVDNYMAMVSELEQQGNQAVATYTACKTLTGIAVLVLISAGVLEVYLTTVPNIVLLLLLPVDVIFIAGLVWNHVQKLRALGEE